GTSKVKFGIFEADLRAGELLRNGSKVKLQEQPFQVLTVLLERPGEVVSREDLRTKLWPSDTFVDFDHSLNAAVRRLRDALGDSAENPRFVETVARRGYRFVARVNGAAPEVTQKAIRKRRWPIVVVIAVVLQVGVVIGFHAAQRISSAPSVQPPDSLRMRAGTVRLSPTAHTPPPLPRHKRVCNSGSCSPMERNSAPLPTRPIMTSVRTPRLPIPA